VTDLLVTSPPQPIRPRQRLPFTLYILTGLLLVKAALIVMVVAGSTALEILRPVLGFSEEAKLLETVRETTGAGAVLLFFALLLVVSVIGMLSRRRIGWLLAMVITGLFVAIDIYSHLNDAANYVWMLLNIITVFYLNQRDVREAVGAAVAEADDTVVAG
jgi:hypothetical protein